MFPQPFDQELYQVGGAAGLDGCFGSEKGEMGVHCARGMAGLPDQPGALAGDFVDPGVNPHRLGNRRQGGFDRHQAFAFCEH